MRFPAILAAALLPALALGADEVPFVVTPDNVTMAMLQIAKVGPEDYLIDLGSGDGRIVITAAKRFGARGLGVEIVADLVAKSRQSATDAGVGHRAHFREQDLFKTDLSPASVVTMYLLPEVNLQLRPRILQLRPGTRIVSHDWDMGEWEPDRTITLPVPDKSVGLEKSSKVHLWVVPARVDGMWCGSGKAKGKSLRIQQSFQKFRAALLDAEGLREFEGRIAGEVLRSPQALTLSHEGERIKATHAAGKYSALKGATFAKAGGQTCK
jgi:hypothetical protein